MIKNKYFNYGLIIFSILVCLGGAVNSGWSGFWLASPFALVLIFYFFRHKTILGFVIGFIVLCITINLTQDKNPLIYPKLNQEIALKDTCGWLVHDSKEYDIYLFNHNEYCSEDSVIGGVTYKAYNITAGNYKVIGVYHSYADMGDKTYHIIDANGKRAVVSFGELAQAPWANKLSLFVMWPVFPILIFGLV